MSCSPPPPRAKCAYFTNVHNDLPLVQNVYVMLSPLVQNVYVMFSPLVQNVCILHFSLPTNGNYLTIASLLQ